MPDSRSPQLIPRHSADWLWYFLKRLPAEDVLLRAMEARFIEQANLPQPCLDLRNPYGQATRVSNPTDSLCTSAVMIGTGEQTPAFGTLREIGRNLTTGGTLLITVPTPDSTTTGVHDAAQTWATLLNQTGFHIERWQPFLDDQAQLASQDEARAWSPILYDLIGHHTLPWRSLLDPVEQNLRPHFRREPSTTGNYLLFIATKAAHAPVEQTLPAINLAPLAIPVAAPAQKEDDKSAGDSGDSSAEQTATDNETPPPTTTDAVPIIGPNKSPVPRRRIPTLPANLALPLVALLGALVAQLMMRGAPEQPGRGIAWWMLGLAALWGMQRVSARNNRSWLAKLIEQFRLLPWTQLATIGTALLVSLIAYSQAERPLIALPLWLIAIIATALVLLRIEPTDETNLANAPPTDEIPQSSIQRLVSNLPMGLNLSIVFTLLAAFSLRFYRLTAHPWVLNGVEAQLGIEAININNVFTTSWLTNPSLPLFLTKMSIAIFGRTSFALRLVPPLIGTLTVYAIYQIGKHLWNHKVGQVAALLLAGSHFHLHYSRIGLTNIWDALLALLAIGGLAIAWDTGRRNTWLRAGAAIGFSAYLFTSAHLVPLMLVALILVALVLHRDQLTAQASHIMAAATFALVIALPQLVNYNANGDVFMERANLLSIERTGWLEAEAIGRGISEGAAFRQQLWRAALGFTATLDKDGMYGPGVPLVNWLTGVFVLLGVGMAIFHIRQMRYAALLSMIGVTIVFGGALLVEAPHSRRYLIALPAVLLLAARALVWLVGKASAQLPAMRQQLVGRLMIVAVVLIALLDVNFYFGEYEASHQFADRNTELAHDLALYLNELEGEWTAYFHGSPAMYISFSTLPYLLTDFEANVNLFDVTDPTTLLPANSANVVHIFVPERVGEMEVVRNIRPNGATKQFSGFAASPLFIVYESSPQ